MNWPSALAVCELLAPDGSHAPVPLRWRPYSRCLLSVWLHTVSSDPRRILLRPSERERERVEPHYPLCECECKCVCVACHEWAPFDQWQCARWHKVTSAAAAGVIVAAVSSRPSEAGLCRCCASVWVRVVLGASSARLCGCGSCRTALYTTYLMFGPYTTTTTTSSSLWFLPHAVRSTARYLLVFSSSSSSSLVSSVLATTHSEWRADSLAPSTAFSLSPLWRELVAGGWLLLSGTVLSTEEEKEENVSPRNLTFESPLPSTGTLKSAFCGLPCWVGKLEELKEQQKQPKQPKAAAAALQWSPPPPWCDPNLQSGATRTAHLVHLVIIPIVSFTRHFHGKP